MEERLKRLKKAMENTVFQDLSFTGKTREEVKAKARNLQIKTDEDVILAVLQLLVHEKTGYELTRSIIARGVSNFEENEGFLYALLHRLERKNYLQSSWQESRKYYQLNDRGRKLLEQSEKKLAGRRTALQELWEG
ncbi:PadR family transcriptional regulator [Bacillus infantis]|uniref:PadR family transcriptional regulator n=1 Tax=Bacillus TaxID=1386 RepID=UPI001CD635C6|nr:MULTISPECIES: PadR family transcriptional regulator [Bacillus]MCA1038425.1 PadR family transcriptional regulator [Bacillus infantis]MDT0162428.1 PadR family transcriptional regulator [Bacillus sp. AG4(2022)]